jgi:hypothetical protein
LADKIRQIPRPKIKNKTQPPAALSSQASCSLSIDMNNRQSYYLKFDVNWQ